MEELHQRSHRNQRLRRDTTRGRSMRRIVTWCVIGAIAAPRSCRGHRRAPRRREPERVSAVEPDPTTTGSPVPAEQTVARAGPTFGGRAFREGRLVYSDEDCGTHVLLLPDLEERPPRSIQACPVLATGDSGVEGIGSVFDGVRAECRRARLTLWTGAFDDPVLYARERGCGAAWNPDGTVTFLQDGGVRRFVRCPGDRRGPLLCSESVVARGEGSHDSSTD